MFEVKLNITPEILGLIAEIDEFKGKWEALKTLVPERLQQLRKVATIESVASSTRIEGVTLTNAEVETVINNLDRQSFATRDEQEVAGYAEVMDLVFEAFDSLHLSENHIKQLHSTLLQYSEKDTRHKGDYKKLSNNVAAFDEDGKQIGIIFETASPFDTPQKMEELVHWTKKALEEKSYHHLLVVSVFIVVFLAIHPFQDGNGRLSRVLTTLLMLQGEYQYVPYLSLERIIEENKDFYYQALRRTQTTLSDDEPNWNSWVAFFLRCLKKQKDGLAAKIEKEKIVAQDMSILALQILDLFKKEGRLSISEIQKLTQGNRNTIKKHLSTLVDSGYIEQHGKGPATWYSLIGD